jgi:hypothetical protein
MHRTYEIVRCSQCLFGSLLLDTALLPTVGRREDETKVIYFRLKALHALVVNHPLSGAVRRHQMVDEVGVGLSARFLERLQRALFLPTVGSRQFCVIIATA